MLGGDAAYSSDSGPVDAAIRDARALGMATYRSVELSSMVSSQTAAPQLGTLKALADDAPLLGPYTVRTANGVEKIARPGAGEAWLSRSGAERMRTPIGGMLQVGGRPLRLAGIVVEEPDRPLNGMELGPRVILPLAEVDAGGLLGPGARATWRASVTGTPDAIARVARLAAEVNEKIENIGARRLQTIMERLVEEISFTAEDAGGTTLDIDATYVDKQLADVVGDTDLSKYIL